MYVDLSRSELVKEDFMVLFEAVPFGEVMSFMATLIIFPVAQHPGGADCWGNV